MTETSSASSCLLAGLLDDKLGQSLERAFRLLGLAHPREDFHRLRVASLSKDPFLRANAGELLDALLRHRDQQTVRELFRIVTEDLPPAERAARSARFVERPPPATEKEALAILARDHDVVLAGLARACIDGPGLAVDAAPTEAPMRDVRHERIQRELLLAAFGARVGAESWVTDRLTSLLEEQRARAGETLFEAGDPPDFYYFLREGRVSLTREGSPPLSYDGPSVFGLSDALLERPRTRTAVAVTDVQVMRVHSEAWIEMLEDSVPVARAAVLGSLRSVAGLEERLWARTPPEPHPPGRHRPLGAHLDVIERLALLTDAPLLRHAGVQTLSELAAACDVVAFEAGDVLLRRDTARERVILLVEGEAQAERVEPRVLWRGGPGEIVCGKAAFGDGVSPWEATARTRGRALTFLVSDWLDLMETHFDMVRRTLGALSLDHERLLEQLP